MRDNGLHLKVGKNNIDLGVDTYVGAAVHLDMMPNLSFGICSSQDSFFHSHFCEYTGGGHDAATCPNSEHYTSGGSITLLGADAYLLFGGGYSLSLDYEYLINQLIKVWG